MYYLIRTLKDIKGHSVNTDFVVDINNDSTIKNFFNEHKIIIVGMMKVEGWPKSAQYRGYMSIDENNIGEFSINTQSIESLIERCIDLGLPLVRVDNIENNITMEDSSTLIKKIQDIKKQDELTEVKPTISLGKKQQQNLVDKRKEKIIEMVSNTLNDLKNIKEKIGENNIGDIRKVDQMMEQLTKIKMGSNIEKATAIIGVALETMEDIELRNIEQVKVQQINEFSSISNKDIIGALEKMKRVQQSSQISDDAMISLAMIYYRLLGVLGLYNKFIWKDIWHRIVNLQYSAGKIHTYIHIILGIRGVELIIYLWIGQIQGLNSSQLLKGLILRGTISLLYTILSYFTIRSFRVYLGLLFAIITVAIITYNMLAIILAFI